MNVFKNFSTDNIPSKSKKKKKKKKKKNSSEKLYWECQY